MPPAPGTITRVLPTQRDPDRVSIFIDGQHAFTLPAIEVAQRRLRPGMELDATAVVLLHGLAEGERAVQASLVYLAYRQRSEREVRDRLRQKGFNAEAIEHAIMRLHGWKYLDDRGFAEAWVQNRAEHSPRGRRALEAELRQKGIARDVADAVLEATPSDEHAAARAVALKRLPSLQSLEPAVRSRRLSAFLARRGYGWDVVGPLMKELELLGNDVPSAPSDDALVNEDNADNADNEEIDGSTVETNDGLEAAQRDEYAAARAVALKRLPSLRSLDAATRSRRLSAFLARRGYRWDVVGPLLKELLGNAAAASPDDDGDDGDEDGD